jgi:hypothetical protein
MNRRTAIRHIGKNRYGGPGGRCQATFVSAWPMTLHSPCMGNLLGGEPFPLSHG